jgi:S-sulfo-L-cysteine synthase (O-acetyl-L-serine-dependent)
MARELPAEVFRAAAEIDRTETISQAAAEVTASHLAAIQGIFCGISAAGACAVALGIAQEGENATIVFVACDRGDRYLSTGAFPA